MIGNTSAQFSPRVEIKEEDYVEAPFKLSDGYMAELAASLWGR